MEICDITSTQGHRALFIVARTNDVLVFICMLFMCDRPNKAMDSWKRTYGKQSAGVAVLKLVRGRHYCSVADGHGLSSDMNLYIAEPDEGSDEWQSER